MRGNDPVNTDNIASGSSSSTQLSPTLEKLDMNHEGYGGNTMNGSTEMPAHGQTQNGDKLKSRSYSKPSRSMINPQGTHLKNHPDRGNGVFATHAIAAGSVIEESPVLVITKKEWEEGNMDGCILGSYGFCWRGGGMGIGLGSGKIHVEEEKGEGSGSNTDMASGSRSSTPSSVSPGHGTGSGSGSESKVEPGSFPSSSSSTFNNTGSRYRLVTDTASLFNHSSSPNINYIRDYEKSVIRFTASRSIEPGEELCICYAADESKLWFINSDEARQQGEEDDETELFPPEEVVELLEADGAGAAEEERRVAEEKKVARQKRLEAMKDVPRKIGRREQKKARFFEKQRAAEEAKARAMAGNGEASTTAIVSPKPAPARQSQPINMISSPSRTPTPNYPAIPERTVSTPSLPAPLHSSKGKSRHEHVGPVVLTPELDWDEGDHVPKPRADGNGDEEWTGIERIKGFTEREEDELLMNDEALMDVWVVEVEEPKTVHEVLRFTKERLRPELEMKHIKRVCRRRNADGVPDSTSRIALCTVPEMDRSALVESLTAFSPLLESLEPYSYAVPKTPARDPAQLATKHAIWPVTLAPFQRKQDASPRFWSFARRTWVEAGIKRVISLALEAQRKGELPVAVYCTSPPASLWPKIEEEGFVPPTIGLRASSHDTRISENHPLRHANLNCIASIARLRTVPPFSEIQAQATRNGADYLLTSLSLFTLHEPCTMCTMALLHSRVREVFYVFPSGKSGGFEGEFGLHSRKDLNHRFEVWKWKDVDLTEEERGLLAVPPGVEV